MDLEREVNLIHQRNKRVEADKAWEPSKTRRGLIALFTYLVMVLFMYSINVANPFVNALIPTLGFILSTLSLPFFKSLWLKHFYSK